MKTHKNSNRINTNYKRLNFDHVKRTTKVDQPTIQYSKTQALKIEIKGRL